MKNTNDLTEGRVSRVLLGFFLPMLFANLLQQLYSFADIAIVGKGLGDNALAAVGNLSVLTLLIIGFAQGITNGFAVVAAQHFGGGNMPALKRAVAASIRLSLVLSLLLTALGLLLLESVLSIMHTDRVIMRDSLVYGYIILGGLTATIAYNLCSGILRAFGDSKTPFLAITVSSAVNILLDCLFVFGMDTGVEGAAIATVLAQAVSVVICLQRLKKAECVQLSREDFKSDRTATAALLRNGLPMACMNSVTAAGCMLVQSCVNALGVEYTSAYSACGKFINLFMLPSVTAGFSLSAFTGQNYGAKDYGRIRSGVRVGLMIGLVSYAALGSVMLLFPEALARLLLNGRYPVELAAGFLRISGSAFFALNFLFVFRSTVQGMGKPLVPMCSGLLEMALRMAVIIFFLPRIGFSAAGYAEAAAWAGALALNIAAYLTVMRREGRCSA